VRSYIAWTFGEGVGALRRGSRESGGERDHRRLRRGGHLDRRLRPRAQDERGHPHAGEVT